MGLSLKTAEHLRTLGHDAIHLREQGLHKLPDPLVMQKAIEENRILATFDLDCTRLVAVGKLKWPSILLFRIEKADTDMVNRLLNQVIERFGAPLVEGCVVVIEEDQIRWRPLPIA